MNFGLRMGQNNLMIRGSNSLSDWLRRLRNTRTLDLHQVLGQVGLGASLVKCRLGNLEFLLTKKLAQQSRRTSSPGLVLVRLLPMILKWHQNHKDGPFAVSDMYRRRDLGRQRQLVSGPWNHKKISCHRTQSSWLLCVERMAVWTIWWIWMKGWKMLLGMILL